MKTYAHLDDILIITKGLIDEYRNTLQKILQKLDEEYLAISTDKCKLACKLIEWIGYHIDSESPTPLTGKQMPSKN